MGTKNDRFGERGVTAAGSDTKIKKLKQVIVNKARGKRSSPRYFSLTIRSILDLWFAGNLHLYPEFQRDIVSTKKWAKDFAEVFRDVMIPVAPITLKEYDDRSSLVFDGTQRLSAILAYCLGVFHINGEWFVDESDPRSWYSLFSSAPVGIEEYYEGILLHETMIDFRNNVKDSDFFEERQTTHTIMSSDDREAFLDKDVPIVTFPVDWEESLCATYIVFTGLQTWKQTKDEYLKHMNDRLSRKLKPLNTEFHTFIRSMSNLSASKSYACLVKTFMLLTKSSDVPKEQEDNKYIDMIVDITDYYMDIDVCEKVYDKLREGIEAMMRSAPQRLLANEKNSVKIDHVCILLYLYCVERELMDSVKCGRFAIDFITSSTSSCRLEKVKKWFDNDRRYSRSHLPYGDATSLKGMAKALGELIQKYADYHASRQRAPNA